MQIRTEIENEQAIAQIEMMMDHNLKDEEMIHLTNLVDAVADYEEAHLPVQEPDFNAWLHISSAQHGGRTVIKDTSLEPRHIYERLTLQEISDDYPEVNPIAFAVADLWFRLDLTSP